MKSRLVEHQTAAELKHLIQRTFLRLEPLFSEYPRVLATLRKAARASDQDLNQLLILVFQESHHCLVIATQDMRGITPEIANVRQLFRFESRDGLDFCLTPIRRGGDNDLF